MKKTLKEDTASVRERERQAVELRNARMTYQDIADKLGFSSTSSARDAILRCYQRDIVQNVEEIRATELATLDALEQTLYSKARRGDEKAIASIIKIMERRAKYLGGLEVPQRHEVTVEAKPMADEFAAFLLGAKDAREALDKKLVK